MRLINYRCDHSPVADVDANASNNQVDKLVDLGVEVRPVVDNIDVRMVPPRFHRSPVSLPRQLQTLEPESTSNINILRVQRGSVGTAVRQAGVQSSSRHPREVILSEQRSNEENGERPRRMRRMIV